MYSTTKDTNIIGTIKNINYGEINEIPIPYTSIWNNWTKFNNNLYYYKYFNFNELIGEYLCKYLSLDSVHNKLALKDNQLYLVTKSFVQSGYNYMMSKHESFNCLLEKCINDKNKSEIIKNHMKLFAIDIYMRQSDRDNNGNIMYKIDKDTNYISLTKAYDFSNAFCNTKNYSNVYFDINFNKYELYQLFKLYPSLEQELIKLKKVELYYIICSILSDYNLEMNHKQFMYYEMQEEQSNKILTKII